jgi:capsular polysaccharide export protein
MAEPRLFCFGFGLWKHRFVRAYLADLRLPLVFCSSPWEARLRGFDRGSRLLVWGVRESPGVARLAEQHEVAIWRMEDGFLRSVGLGTDFVTPASLVLDRRGIYFDPGAPSDLEELLQSSDFSDDELVRAAKLRDEIVRAALSKYNFRGAGQPLTRPAAERVLLVPGQVEQDASILRGCVDVRSNEQLLREVRRANPGAHVIYKPHPDVVSGNRAADESLRTARLYADQVITDRPLPACLAIADEVHTMTSLVGFEALLRGKRVVSYGQPFYSGWGLTTDRHPVSRRTRKLTLDMLVAGVLIRYPRYLSQTTRTLTTPEVVLEELRIELERNGATLPRAGIRQRIRRRLRVIKGLLHGS